MKIAAAAYPIDWHNRWNDYVGKLRVWVRTAAENGAELLVFPEYAALELSSLAGEDNARDLQRSIDAVTARIKDVDELHGSLAREFAVHVCAATGPVRRGDGRAVNRARLFAPDGSHGTQDKLAPTRFEREAWNLGAGDAARVFSTALGRIGVLVGQDAAAPRIAQAMAAAGAEVLLAPGCSDTPGGYWRLRAGAMARALEGQCLVVLASTIGDAGWLSAAARNVGAAAIFGPPEAELPEEGVVAVGKMNAAGWVYGEASLDAVRALRAEGEAMAGTDGSALDASLARVETVTLGAAAPP